MSADRPSSIGFVGAVLFAASPFIVYAAVVTQVPQAAPDWPAHAIVAASFDDVLQEVVVVDARDPATVIAFPVDTMLRIGGVGEVRASTALRVGGFEALATGFGEILQEEIHFYIQISSPSVFGSTFTGVEGNLGDRAAQIEAILASVETGQIRLINAPGTHFQIGELPAYRVDVAALFSELAGEGLPPVVPAPGPVTATATPEPSPSPVPQLTPTPLGRSEITVEVLNAGAPSGSAGEVGDRLTAAGFDVINVSNADEPTVGVKVYYVSDPAKGAEVASVLDATAEAIPDDRSTDADVLVLVSRE